MSFGSATLVNGSSFAGANSHLFLAKYGAAGDLLWAKQATGPSSEVPQGLAVDDAGEVFLTGYYSGAAVFGSLATLTNAGSTDLFLAEFQTPPATRFGCAPRAARAPIMATASPWMRAAMRSSPGAFLTVR